jgi:hypothetical protein
MRIFVSIAIYSAVLAGSAAAGVVSIGAGAFPGSATLITFEGASGQITNQYAGQGVTVTGGVLYATGAYSIYLGSPTDAANFASECPCNFVTLGFSTPITQIGFDAVINPGGTLTVSDSDGSLMYPGPAETNEFFAGFQDLAGFTSVTLGYSAGGGFNGAFAIDNLEFDGTASSPPTTIATSGVPEPGSMSMAAIGLAALFLAARATKARARATR